jgi:hypothetical protein
MNIAEAVATAKQSVKMDNRLKAIKVICATSAIGFALFGWAKMSSGNIIGAGMFGLFAADLLRVSYNCYLTNYCSIAISKYCGSIAALSGTIFTSLKTAVGLANPADDPLIRLKHDILWEVLAENTISKYVYDQVIEDLSILLPPYLYLHVTSVSLRLIPLPYLYHTTTLSFYPTFL